PLYYMLGFVAVPDLDEKFIADFCAGLKSMADRYKISLIGGDTVKSGKQLAFSITIFVETDHRKILQRNAAKNNDLVFVSGHISDTYLGLKIIQSNNKNAAKISGKSHHKNYNYL